MHQGLTVMDQISVSGPWITQREVDYVTDAVTNAWYGKANMYHIRFEKAFADYLGVKYAVALPSCTSAIHLSLLALNIGKGDEVIVPDVTWIASAAPVAYVRGTPVFADIDQETWCLSPTSFEACITTNTRAVIPVDLYGNMPDMDAIRLIAERHNIFVIEDSAEAIGSEYRGKKAGSLGDTGVFSFHGSKTLTTGEGGMLVTDGEDIYHRVLTLRDHGRPPGDTSFYNTEVAYKYKMSSMQAALGLAQIERVDELVRRKREIFDWYSSELEALDGIQLNSEPSGTRNSYWMVTVILHPRFALKKERLLELMKEKGIDCRPFFHPLSSIPAFQRSAQASLARQRNVVSYRISPYGINLPCGMNVTKEKVRYICDSFKEIISGS